MENFAGEVAAETKSAEAALAGTCQWDLSPGGPVWIAPQGLDNYYSLQFK